MRGRTALRASLKANPDFEDVFLELANLRTRDKKFAEAEDLLRKYVKVSRDPSAGYYKLAMVERSMHQTAAAQRDLNVFQSLSKNSATGPYPYQHLFDYLENRSHLTSQQRTQLDVSELTAQIQKNPGQPQDLYLLTETYLKLGERDEAEKTVAQLDQVSANDYRTQTGVGVLLLAIIFTTKRLSISRMRFAPILIPMTSSSIWPMCIFASGHIRSPCCRAIGIGCRSTG